MYEQRRDQVPRTEARLIKEGFSDEVLFGWGVKDELGVCQVDKRGKGIPGICKEITRWNKKSLNFFFFNHNLQ